MCTNAELILGYVYGELPDAERRAFETHLAACGDCATEVAGLQATRGHLASWTPPEPDFGFRIVRGSSASAPPARRFRVAPAWGLAAAAVLVLAAAAAIANVEVRYDTNGLVVRTGWVRDVATPQSAGGAVADVTQPSAAADAWRAEIAALQSRLGELETAALARESGGAAQASGPRMSEAEIIRSVREIVSQSETRQQREFALELARVVDEVDRARKMDFYTIQQGIGRLRGQIPADVQQHLNYYLTRVSQEK
jgi:anti-sigma factor RsiW